MSLKEDSVEWGELEKHGITKWGMVEASIFHLLLENQQSNTQEKQEAAAKLTKFIQNLLNA